MRFSRRSVVLAAALVLQARGAPAFPPYRSTDAETAEPGTLEARLGLVRLEREHHDDTYTSPLLRANLGLVENLELVSEFEYRPEQERVEDGAVGLKAVSPAGPWHVGIETLALLPVSPDHSGVGVESQLVGTLRRAPLRLHLNAGGFYDPRPADAEQGWRASLLAEVEKGRARPGVELFAKQVHGESIRAQAGVGVILDVGPFDVRSALHLGLTSAAPNLAASVWIAWHGRLWQENGGQPPGAAPRARASATLSK